MLLKFKNEDWYCAYAKRNDLRLEMNGLWCLAVFSPAIRYSSDRKNRRLSLLSGLCTRVCAPCNLKNEKLVWPYSPG